jgi:hypothetical protein
LKLWVHYEKVIATILTKSGKAFQVKAPLKIASKAEWAHFAVVIYDDRLVLSVNGVATSSTGDLKEFGSEDDLELQIGTGGPHHPFLGVLDEMRVYKNALSTVDISQLAASGEMGGELEGEKLPPLAYAGATQTLWKPVTSVMLKGRCDAQGPSSSQIASVWSIVSVPDMSAATLVDANSLTATLHFQASPPAGDYELQLDCSSGADKTSSKVLIVLFEAHEAHSGITINSKALSSSFSNAGEPSSPRSLWLFDGNAAQASSHGINASLHPVRHANGMAFDFTSDGRFGGGLHLHCEDSGCAQLNLGNPEPSDSPWEAFSVSLWFKSDKIKKLAMFAKGSFKMQAPKMYAKDAGKWHHWVVVVHPDFQKEYFDGELKVHTGSGQARTRSDAASNMTFGIRSGHASYGFDGILDELAVFDFALSNDEVDMLRTQSASGFTKRGTQNPLWLGGYNTSMIAEYFPEIPFIPNYEGFVGGLAPSKTPPEAHRHPRIFLGPEDLPAIREKLQSTTAGLIAMENVRSLLQDIWPRDILSTRNLTLSEVQSFKGANGVDTNILTQLFIFEAFRCLIDGDRAGALRLGQQLDSLAAEQIHSLDSHLNILGMAKATVGQMFNDTWKDVGQVEMLRGTTMAFCYDLLYPYLPDATRTKLRRALTMSTAHTWSIGMDALPSFGGHTSNWLPWVTGDLLLTLLSVEGEDGFDEGVYTRVAQAFQAWATFGVSAVSGATFEGGGKNSIAGPKLLALAKHGHPDSIGAPGVRKFAEDFLVHTMLPNGNFIEDDLWGGCESKPPLEDVLALKVAFPNSSKVDWVYRNAIDGSGYAGVFHDNRGAWPYRQFAPSRARTYGYNNFLQALIYAQDVSGPANWSEHGASALRSEPLTYVAKDRGLLITRSAWAEKEAAWLWLNIRSLKGGHAAPARGGFAFYALGEVWGFYNTGHNLESEKHSIILVDGQGQGRHAPGKFVQFLDSHEATFGTADTREAYTNGHFGGSPDHQTVNDFLLEKGPYAWQALPYCYLPHWFDGVSRGQCSLPGPSSSFRKAFRTAGLVRAESNPYALILDDIEKDSAVRNYSWRMVLKPTLSHFDSQMGLFSSKEIDRSYAQANGDDIILKKSDGGGARLLVRLLQGSSPHKSISVSSTGSPALQIESEVSSASFRILLWPLAEGVPLPVTQWDESKQALTISSGPFSSKDVFNLGATSEGATVVKSMERSGRSIVFETNKVAQ